MRSYLCLWRGLRGLTCSSRSHLSTKVLLRERNLLSFKLYHPHQSRFLSSSWHYPYSTELEDQHPPTRVIIDTIEEYDRIIEQDPQNYRAYYEKGRAINHLGPKDTELYLDKVMPVRLDFGYEELMICCYKRAIALNPNFAEPYNSLGVIRAKNFAEQEALKLFDEAIAINPNYADAYVNKANAINPDEEALILYDRAKSINPKHFRASFDKGICLMKLNRLEEAMECFDHASTLDKTRIEPYFYKAKSLESLKRYDEAIKFFDKVIALNPENYFSYWNKGNIYFKLNLFQKARINFDKSCNLFRQERSHMVPKWMTKNWFLTHENVGIFEKIEEIMVNLQNTNNNEKTEALIQEYKTMKVNFVRYIDEVTHYLDDTKRISLRWYNVIQGWRNTLQLFLNKANFYRRNIGSPCTLSSWNLTEFGYVEVYTLLSQLNSGEVAPNYTMEELLLDLEVCLSDLPLISTKLLEYGISIRDLTYLLPIVKATKVVFENQRDSPKNGNFTTRIKIGDPYLLNFSETFQHELNSLYLLCHILDSPLLEPQLEGYLGKIGVLLAALAESGVIKGTGGAVQHFGEMLGNSNFYTQAEYVKLCHAMAVSVLEMKKISHGLAVGILQNSYEAEISLLQHLKSTISPKTPNLSDSGKTDAISIVKLIINCVCSKKVHREGWVDRNRYAYCVLSELHRHYGITQRKKFDLNPDWQALYDYSVELSERVVPLIPDGTRLGMISNNRLIDPFRKDEELKKAFADEFTKEFQETLGGRVKESLQIAAYNLIHSKNKLK